MTINKDEKITIDRWKVLVGVPLFISLTMGFSAGRFGDGRKTQIIEDTKARLEQLDQEKVDRKEFNLIMERLNKLDQIGNQVNSMEGMLQEHVRTSK